MEAEEKHRCCRYGRRTAEIPPDIGFHTIADGELLFCAHPMLFPVVCEYFRARREAPNVGSV